MARPVSTWRAEGHPRAERQHAHLAGRCVRGGDTPWPCVTSPVVERPSPASSMPGEAIRPIIRCRRASGPVGRRLRSSGAPGARPPHMLFPTIDFAIFFLVVFTGNWLLRPHRFAWKVFILARQLLLLRLLVLRADHLPLAASSPSRSSSTGRSARPCSRRDDPRRRAHRPQPLAGAGRGRRRPRRARLLQVRQLLPRLVHRAPGRRSACTSTGRSSTSSCRSASRSSPSRPSAT